MGDTALALLYHLFAADMHISFIRFAAKLSEFGGHDVSMCSMCDAAVCVQVPSPKDIQKKLDNPLAAIPTLKDLANKAKLNTPNAGNVASKVPPPSPPDPLSPLTPP